MASRKVKCYGVYCEPYGIKHPKDEMIKLGSHNYCKECYEYEVKMRKERQELYDFLHEEYGFTTPLMKKHAKEMYEKNGWSYKKILLLIKFTINIKNKRYNEKFGITLYQNHYSEFISYVKEKKKRKNQNKGKRNKKVVTKINPRDLNNNTYVNNKLYNMEEDK